MTAKMKVNIAKLPRIKASDFRKSGLFNSLEIKSGKLTLTENLKFRFTYYPEESLIQLMYKAESEVFSYYIELVEIKSNLGKGIIYNFICPETKNRCRQLYFDYSTLTFKSRNGIKGHYYSEQKKSKLDRILTKYYGNDRKIDKLYEVERFKKYYNGKLTRRYKKVLKLEQQTIEALNQYRELKLSKFIT